MSAPSTKAIADFADVQGGLQVTHARAQLPIEVPYLRVANVFRDQLDLREIKSLHVTAAEFDRTLLAAGDLLVVEGHGDPEEIGRCAVWSDEVTPCVHQNHLIRVRVDPSRVTPKYISAYLNSHVGRQQLVRAGKTTSGLNTININDVRAVQVPLPPLPEQRRIADILDKADAIRRKRKEAIALMDLLVQACFVDMFGDPRVVGSCSRLPTTPHRMGELTRVRTGKLDANAADEDGAFPFFTCAKEPLKIDNAAFDCKAVLVAGNGDLNVKYYEGKFNAYQRTYVIESLDESKLDPKFLFAFLDLYVSELRKQSIGGVIKYIKLPYLTEAIVPLPSPELQSEFVNRLDAARQLEGSLARSLDQTESLFSSLVDRAFRGELTAPSSAKPASHTKKQLAFFEEAP